MPRRPPWRPIATCRSAPCSSASARPKAPCSDALDRFRARAPAKHALCGEVGGRATVVVAANGALSGEQLAEALRSVLTPDAAVFVGEGEAVDELRDAPRSHRHALAAMKVANGDVTRWDDLRAAAAADRAPADRARATSPRASAS